MPIKNTVTTFKNLIIFECFLCINRTYLLSNKRIKHICDYIYYFIYIFVFCAAIYDIVVSYSDITLNIIAFLVLNALELITLSIAARYSRSKYSAIEKLDAKFGLDDDYIETLKRKSDLATVAAMVSLLADVYGMMQLNVKPGLMMVFCLGSAAHDTELTFISLFVDIINIRLAKSMNAHPSLGCAIYRHILVAASYFNHGFQFTILLMLLSTLINTIIVGFALVVHSDMDAFLFGYLIWRAVKTFYSLWIVCSAAYRTKVIWKRLGFHLASKLALQSRISNESSKYHQTLQRWYFCVTSQETGLNLGQDIPVGLHVPLIIVDISVNYLLVFIQFYMAYPH